MDASSEDLRAQEDAQAEIIRRTYASPSYSHAENVLVLLRQLEGEHGEGSWTIRHLLDLVRDQAPTPEEET